MLPVPQGASCLNCFTRWSLETRFQSGDESGGRGRTSSEWRPMPARRRAEREKSALWRRLPPARRARRCSRLRRRSAAAAACSARAALYSTALFTARRAACMVHPFKPRASQVCACWMPAAAMKRGPCAALHLTALFSTEGSPVVQLCTKHARGMLQVLCAVYRAEGSSHF